MTSGKMRWYFCSRNIFCFNVSAVREEQLLFSSIIVRQIIFVFILLLLHENIIDITRIGKTLMPYHNVQFQYTL